MKLEKENWKQFNIPLNYANASTIHFTAVLALSSSDGKRRWFNPVKLQALPENCAKDSERFLDSFILQHFSEIPQQTRE